MFYHITCNLNTTTNNKRKFHSVEHICIYFREVKTPSRNFLSHGTLKNTNTIDDFKNCDKMALLNKHGIEVSREFKRGKLLNCFNSKKNVYI